MIAAEDRPATSPEGLKTWRARYGLSQAQAAALLPVSVKTWQSWELARERGGREPPGYLGHLLALLGERL